jgi:molybdopterin converting factor small subunit
MSIRVTYFAQAARLIGRDTEMYEAVDLKSLLKGVYQRNGSNVENLICSSDGEPVPWILIDVDGELVRDQHLALSPGTHVRFISPISGG